MVRLTVVSKPQWRLRRAAQRILVERLGTRTARIVQARASSAYPQVAAQIPATRFGARDLLRTSAYVIALDRALEHAGLDRDRARELIADVVYQSIMPARAALVRLARLRYGEDLDGARKGIELSRRLYYTPPDWVMEDVEFRDGLGFDVTRCVVAEFFQSYELGDLCDAAICAQDIRSAEHHGVVLERSATLAAGGDRCDFRYRFGRSEEPARDRRRVDTLRRSPTRRAALTESVEIDASPEQAWEWLATMADHYADWHPDHVDAKWVHGPPNEVGSRMKAVESLGGHRQSMTLEMTAVDPPWSMKYRILGVHGVLLSGGSFEIAARHGGAVFTAGIDVRFPRFACLIFRRRMEALRTHMREEGQSLKRLLEARMPSR